MVDYVSSLSIDFSLIYPEITLLLGASLILLSVFSRQLGALAPGIGVVTLVLALGFTAAQWGDQKAGFAGMVTCDDFGTMFKGIFTVASFLTLLIAHRYMKVRGIDKPEFYALILVSTVGMMVMANSTDLIVMFLGLEIMSIPLYVMAGFNRRSLESNESAIKYFIMGAFASAFLLMGIAFIFGAAETTNLRRIAADFSYIAGHFGVYLYAGIALIVVGFGFKVAAVPFHSWVPDVYQGAPTPVTAFFSVAPKAAGFAAMLRIFVYGMAGADALTELFWILAVLTMSVGNILALRQDNVKRMLAYSSISHAGYIIIALVVGGSDAVSAAIFYLVAYTLFNLGAFAIVTHLECRSGCKSDLPELSGLAGTNPYLSVALGLFMFALAGFPPTVGFFAKFYLFAAAVKAGFVSLVVIAVLNSFVSVYYYLRVVKACFFDSPSAKPLTPIRMVPSILIVVIVTAVGTLGLGFFPQRLLELSQAAIFAFL
ncbi:MAG: NADH-quinone oxidoreductase subunit N [Candidatus Zixiibacteriota bacterium]|nr:MAG: NADH-quinone oxidoreductase subunit N [candidate division Zixibacteria bacterium]